MNERIKALAEQAAVESFDQVNELALEVSVDDQSYQVPAAFIARLSELIVQECAGVTLDYKNHDHYTGWCDHAAEILKHFGVEE